jgi:outer membrane protein assembly factor BamB
MFDVALTTYSPGTTLTSPTASADGVVYFGDSKGIVHAVNTSTGAVVFDRNIKNGEGVAPANAARKPLGRITRWNIGGVPRVFCVTSDNYLMEFALDGTPISTTQLDGGGTAVNASAMALEDAVYVAAANGTDIVVTKLDSAGAVTTSRHFAGTSTSTVSVYGDSVFFSTSYGSYRLKASDLTVTNTYAAGVAPPFVASTASASPVAIVVTADGHVNAYSATTGNAVADFGSSGSVDLELPASVSTYEILGSFSATTGFFPMNVEDFGSLPASPGSSWTSALANGMQFTAAPSAGNLTRLSSNTTPYCLSTDTANSSITLTFTGDVKAVGGRFFVTDDAGTPVSGDVSVTANGTSQTKTIDPANRPFYGVSVPTGISTLTVSPLNSTQHVAMDDVRVCSLPNVTAAPFVYGGKIYVGAVNNSVYCLNMANGSGGGPSGSKVVFDAADVLDSSASAITAGVSVCPTGSGYLLFGSTNGYEISLSLADGEFAGLTFPHAPEQIVSETGATTTDNILIPITSVAAYDPLTGTLLYSAGNSMYQIAPDTFEEGK